MIQVLHKKLKEKTTICKRLVQNSGAVLTIKAGLTLGGLSRLPTRPLGSAVLWYYLLPLHDILLVQYRPTYHLIRR
jgi:hypothetical protein